MKLLLLLAAVAVLCAAPTSAQPDTPTPLSRFVGLGETTRQDSLRYAKQERATEVLVARCMRAQGFRYAQSTARRFRSGELGRTADDTNSQYVSQLPQDRRREYYMALIGVTDPNDESAVPSEENPGCVQQAHAQIQSVYEAPEGFKDEVVSIQRSVSQAPAVVRAQTAWTACMQRNGYAAASPAALFRSLDEAAAAGDLASAEARAREAQRQSGRCAQESGLREARRAARAQLEAALVDRYRDRLERRRQRLEAQEAEVEELSNQADSDG